MIIPGRFNGPPGSGNGGYSAGIFADGAPREVTLRMPPPLDTPLSLVEGRVRDPDGAVVAEVAPTGAVDTVVPPIGYADAQRASAAYVGFTGHPFPTCYVCGPDRADGLGIFPGPVSDGRTAAPWTVPADVSPAMVWAALDCPGGWAIIGPARPYVLGRIAVQPVRMPAPGDLCVVVGELAAAEGRKALVHSTLYGPDGAELARARATWIAVAG
ncbi:hypothetical protein [Micromonospora sp. NBC_01796]|uniref:hypothetical protein n=1 Tax=Micromonospora sp. NBC_01796 TaxID=2975987 RepID=UPI002DDACC9C|nr:hypothetical protein [Micromonospora sp. NBC_01796]WSA84750.1 hypothetical protein OIE47_31025 [Micromonospora sp. NBC_01796]